MKKPYYSFPGGNKNKTGCPERDSLFILIDLIT